MLHQEATLDTVIAPAGSTSRRTSPKPITLTINNTCKISGLGPTKIYELIKLGKLKTMVIGRRRLVLYASIEELLRPTVA